MKLRRSIPWTRFMNNATCTFSPPWSDLTLEGNPWMHVALRKWDSTVLAQLSVLQFRYVIRRECPSMAPWITNPHLKKKMSSVSVSIYIFFKSKLFFQLLLLWTECYSSGCNLTHMLHVYYKINKFNKSRTIVCRIMSFVNSVVKILINMSNVWVATACAKHSNNNRNCINADVKLDSLTVSNACCHPCAIDCWGRVHGKPF